MTLAAGTRVHVYAEMAVGRATIEATWRSSAGELRAYHVSFDDGGLAWVEPLAVFSIEGLDDRPVACWATTGSRA